MRSQWIVIFADDTALEIKATDVFDALSEIQICKDQVVGVINFDDWKQRKSKWPTALMRMAARN